MGLWVFLAGSVLCALSPALLALVASRAVQGFAAGMLITLMASLPVEMARARGIAALLLAFAGVSQGADLLAAEVMVPLAVGVASVAAFCLLPATRDPERALIDISLMRVRSVSAASAAMFCAGCVLYSAQFLLPLFWQELMGRSVLEAALLLIPQGVGALMSRTLAGRLTDSHGGRVVSMGGFAAVAVTTAPFLVFGPTVPTVLLEALLLVRKGEAAGARAA